MLCIVGWPQAYCEARATIPQQDYVTDSGSSDSDSSDTGVETQLSIPTKPYKISFSS